MIRHQIKMILGLVLLYSAAAWAEEPYSRITPVVEAFDKNKDAVVSITGKQLAHVEGIYSRGFEDWPFLLPKRSVETPFLGSGFVLSPRGYIITNAHVVSQATEITVNMADGSKYQARIIAADTSADLAVLKIETDKPLPAVTLGKSDDLKIGETVLAIGNPFGYQHTLTDGIISAIHRQVDLEQLSLQDLIQISAPINPGNSGGPLLNINGEVIGINTAIRKAAQGIGFAIPIDWLKEKIPTLLNVDKLRRIDLGLEIGNIQAVTKERQGVLVKSIRPGSATHVAGFEVGDIIIAVNGSRVNSALDFYLDMLEQQVGSEVRFSVTRDSNQSTEELGVTLKQRPLPDGTALAKQLFGIEVTSLTEPMIRRYSIAGKPGMVVVTEVQRGGPADNAGVEPGDLLVALDGTEIANLEILGLVLEEVGEGVLMKITMNRTESYFGYQRLVQYTSTVRTHSMVPSEKSKPKQIDI
jgi:serine protease Do